MKTKEAERRGISPIIATLLIILITIAAGLILYAFVSGWLGGATKSTATAQGELLLDYADAYNDGTTNLGVVDAWVRNVGGVTVNIVSAYIEAPDGTVEEVTPTGTLTIDPQQVAKITLNSANAFTSGYVYTVKLVASDGTSLVFQVRAR